MQKYVLCNYYHKLLVDYAAIQHMMIDKDYKDTKKYIF